jgi:hypothetical protein
VHPAHNVPETQVGTSAEQKQKMVKLGALDWVSAQSFGHFQMLTLGALN